jgi:hypothetical protein
VPRSTASVNPLAASYRRDLVRADPMPSVSLQRLRQCLHRHSSAWGQLSLNAHSVAIGRQAGTHAGRQMDCWIDSFLSMQKESR